MSLKWNYLEKYSVKLQNINCQKLCDNYIMFCAIMLYINKNKHFVLRAELGSQICE